jgi:hypothetical protein
VKAHPRCAVEYLRGLKVQEGIEAQAGLKTLSVSTGRCSDQCSGGQASGSGVVGVTRLQRRKSQKVKRERAGDESGRLGIGENPCRANLRRGCGMK